MEEQIKEWVKQHPGCKLRDIALHFGKSEGYISKVLNNKTKGVGFKIGTCICGEVFVPTEKGEVCGRCRVEERIRQRISDLHNNGDVVPDGLSYILPPRRPGRSRAG